jgi:hypothetical protein
MLNNRMPKKWLLTMPLLLWLVVLWQSPGFAGRSIAEFSDPSAFRSGAEAMAQPHGFILSDNHRTDEVTRKKDASDSGAAGDNSAKNNENETKKENNKTKSLKSFEPTEKVKADQAVDFPWDI